MRALPPRDFLSLSRQRALFRDRSWLRALLLVAGFIAIVAWQGTFRANAERLDAGYAITHTFGGQLAEFAYFYHYLGLFPVSALEGPRPEPTPEAAQRALRERGSELRLEQPYDRMAVVAYLPDIHLGGDPYTPRHNAAAWLGFTVALAALYAALWSARLELFGLVLVVLIGSDPFQLHGVYVQDNVFGWVITIGLVVTAINVPLIINHRYYLTNGGLAARYLWLAPVLTGAVLGTFRHMRTECVTTMIAAMVAYALLSGISWHRKISLVVLLLATFIATDTAWNTYFDRMEARTMSIVTANGGDATTTRGEQRVHLFWHPMWGGLGDFDGKYGYLFWDRVISDYAAPFLDPQSDSQARVQMRWKDTYAAVLRDKILADVIGDPVWYATIVVKRLHRMLMENTPPRLAVGGRWFDVPGLPLLLVPFGAVAAACYLARREWSMLRLSLFPFAIGGVAVAVTSVNGYHYYALVHLFLYALLVAWILEALCRLTGPRTKESRVS